MFKKLILGSVLAFFFLSCRLVFAGVVISEIKLLPIEDRFIKLFNQDNSDVDLTNWYIQRKTQNGTQFDSLVTSTFFKDKKINAGSYFLISRSQTESSDIVLGGLTLTESNAIQIKNPNGEVVDKVCWGEITECGDARISNPASGQSVKFIVQTFVTPPPSNSTSSENSDSSTTITTESKTKIVETPKIKTQIIAKTLGFVGLPLSLNATILGLNGEQLHFGKYFWNFGDGDSKEIQIIDSGQFTHTYFYPGDYIVSLDYYQNPYSSVSDASNQITIKIVPNDIFISKVGDEKDFFVELTNNTNYNADISNWILGSSLKSFIFPKNTVLGSKNKIIFSPKITNLSISDKDTLKLMTPQREILFDYSVPILAPVAVVSIKTPSKNTVQQKTSTTPDQIKSSTAVKSIEGNSATSALDEQIPVENLSASVVSSDVIKDNPVRIYFLTTILTVFLGLSAGAVYFIRQKKMVSRIGDDFKILDE